MSDWSNISFVLFVLVVESPSQDNGHGNTAGGGGGLAWKNNIPVTPGVSYVVEVGAGGAGAAQYYNARNGIGNGGDSYFINATTVKAHQGWSEWWWWNIYWRWWW